MFTKEQVQQLLSEGKTLGDLVNLTLNAAPEPVQSPLVQRAALVRWFDKPLFDAVLSEGLPGSMSWEEFQESGDIEPMGSEPPRFAVHDGVAKAALNAWKQRPEDLRAISRELANYFESDPIEHFTHLVLADPDRAQDEFLRLYRAADGVFDLARCDTLIRTLRHRNGLFPNLLSQGLRNALSDREQYYRSRCLFADDYWRTMAFVERPEIVEHFEKWQGDSKRWVLHLYGKGGFGKTMLVRWLIARRCVREIEGRRIPVARLDSDFVDLASLARWPWLVLLPVAQQFDVQLPGSPFGSFLKSFGDFAAVLRRPSGRGQDDSRTTLLNRLAPEAERLEDQIPKLFQSNLGQSRVVIVLDTIEELLLHHRSGLEAMLNYTAVIQRKCPGLQLLLSGRYNLADPDRLPSFMSQHCPPEDRVRIEGFREQESMHYLRNLRQVPETRPLQAIIEKTQGNPFELALFADLALANPNLTEDEVRRYPETQYARLIERIIDRIPPDQHGVAWLLRYAAIPRQLTFEFVRDVLGPFLSEEMARRSQMDQPNDFGDELAVYSGREVWRQHCEEDLQRIWNQLCQYASDHSWVELKGEVLTLQPEVRVPMRQLLRPQQIYPVLQKAAVEYFERRAAQDPNQWIAPTIEALYHRFHLDGLGAAQQWREALASAGAKDLTCRVRLAEIPLSGDFVTDTGEPVLYPGGALVDYELLTEAAAEQAWTLLIERLRTRSFEASSDRLEGELRDAYRRFREFYGRMNNPRVEASRRLILEGADAFFADRYEAAEKLLQEAEGSVKNPAERVVLDFLRARALSDRKPEEAEALFAAAAEKASLMEDPPLSPGWIEFRRGRRLEDREEFERALECYERAFTSAAVSANEMAATIDAPELLSRICRMLRGLGRWSDADAVVIRERQRKAVRENPKMQYEASYAQVRLALDRYNVARAFELLPQGLEGSTLMLHAWTYGAALNVPQAEERFNQARDALINEGSYRGPVEALISKVYLFLDALGNVHQAEETLHSIPSRMGDYGSERVVAEARILLESGKAEFAASSLRASFGAKLSAGFVRVGAAARHGRRSRLLSLSHLAGLGLANAAEANSFLVELSRTAISARYPFLEPFRLTPIGPAVYSSLRDLFRRVVPMPDTGDADAVLRARLWGLAAPAFDCAAEARDLLAAVYPQGQPHLRRQLRTALWRSGCHQLPDRDAYLREYEAAYGQFPELMGTALLEEAEHALTDDCDRARDLLQKAGPVITERFPDHSLWVARLHALTARLAEISGPTRAGLNAWLTAQRSADESGAVRAGHEIAKEIEKYKTEAIQAHQDFDLLPPATVVQVEASPESKIHVTFPGNEAAALQFDMVVSGSRGYAFEWIEPLAYSREQILRQFGDAFGPFAAWLTSRHRELRTARGALASLPWEAILPPAPGQYLYRRPIESVPIRDTVVLIQEAIRRSGQDIVVDGIYGPQTDGLLRNAGENPRAARSKLLAVYPPMEKPQVLIVQRSAEEERFLKRSHGTLGIDLLTEYQDAGLDVFRLTDPKQLATAISRFRPSLIHVVAGFQESSRTGEVYVDFGDPDSAVSAGSLDGLVRRASGLGIHPFVTIEAVLPPDTYDQARQAILRNAFCDELFRFGNTRGVLAAGLAGPNLLPQTLQVMAAAAASRGFAGDLRENLAGMPLFIPPALFTLDPEIPVIW